MKKEINLEKMSESELRTEIESRLADAVTLNDVTYFAQAVDVADNRNMSGTIDYQILGSKKMREIINYQEKITGNIEKLIDNALTQKQLDMAQSHINYAEKNGIDVQLYKTQILNKENKIYHRV